MLGETHFLQNNGASLFSLFSNVIKGSSEMLQSIGTEGKPSSTICRLNLYQSCIFTSSNISILCICLVYNRSCTILNICPVVALLLAPVWSPPTSCSMHSYLSAVWAERVITRSSFTDEFTVELSRDDVQKINI